MASPPDTHFIDEPPAWAAIVGFEGCVDWPANDGWPTATRPPVAGSCYKVAVRFPFEVARGGEFWTLFEAAPEIVNGWEVDQPEGPDLLRLVRCRHLADRANALDRAVPASSAVRSSIQVGGQVDVAILVEVEVLETISLADLAALPVAAPADAHFSDWIDSGWAPPLENCGLRVALSEFERVGGDFGSSLIRTVDPGGGGILVFTGMTQRARFFWAGRRTLSAEEAALIARGSDPA